MRFTNKTFLNFLVRTRLPILVRLSVGRILRFGQQPHRVEDGCLQALQTYKVWLGQLNLG
jgi:hypothetical protein